MWKGIYEYKKLTNPDELAILKWLVKYEKLSEPLILFLFEDFDIEFPERSAWYKVDDLKIDSLDFYDITEFSFLHSDRYWTMLEKYTTFSTEKQTEYMNADSSNEKVTSLGYHLKRRGIID